MNKELIKSLSTLLGLDVEELTKGLTEEKSDFKLKDGLKVYSADDKIFTQEQVEQIKDNHGKTRYDAGKLAGSEMLMKDVAKAQGFDESINDSEKFITAFKSKILEEAKMKPDEKVSELEKSLENLRSKLGEKDKSIESLQGQITSSKRVYEIQSFLPSIPESLNISRADATDLYMKGREFKEDGIYLNGNRLVDETEKPITVEQDVKSWFEGKGWGSENFAGRGGGAGGGTGGDSGLPKTMEEYESHLKQKGINAGSAEANALLAEVAEKHPEILQD